MKTPVLITAGATRNPIDSMRCITANASGRTGIWLAENLHLGGRHTVSLLGSQTALLRKNGSYTGTGFSSTRDLLSKMHDWVKEHPSGIVVHSSAVGDFEVANTSEGKIKSGRSITIQLQPTPKILDRIKEWSPAIFLVSFKAAAPETDIATLETIATKQRQRSLSDLVFANVLGRTNKDILLCSDKETQYFAERTDALNALLHKLVSLSHLAK